MVVARPAGKGTIRCGARPQRAAFRRPGLPVSGPLGEPAPPFPRIPNVPPSRQRRRNVSVMPLLFARVSRRRALSGAAAQPRASCRVNGRARRILGIAASVRCSGTIFGRLDSIPLSAGRDSLREPPGGLLFPSRHLTVRFGFQYTVRRIECQVIRYK